MQDGGSFMWVILSVSIVALAIFCERATFLYFRLKIDPDQAFQKVLVNLEKYNYHGALSEASKIESHPLGRILKSGLLKSDKRDRDIELAMEESLLKEIPPVKARVNYLSLFANIATLLGLLGTIMGLIGAFKGVSNADAAMKQELLAQGISIAMLTTAFGLAVAILCLVGYYLLTNRGDYIVDQFEEKALRMLNILSALKRQQQQEEMLTTR